MSIDTACSASLIGVHVGQSNTENEFSLCGGVNAILHNGTFAFFTSAGMLSMDGRCKTFDEHADGYSRSEGCSLFLLQRSTCTGDVLVSGTCANQDGRSSALTAPSGPSQVLAISGALSIAKKEGNGNIIVSNHFHGTGTALGDPIEVGSYIACTLEHAECFSSPTCTSSKGNIGHAETASGLLSLHFTCASLKDRLFVTNLHLKKNESPYCTSFGEYRPN
jgi:acyl transferase domain-containing protein